MARIARSPSASTQPRSGQTPSAKTISKLSTATGDWQAGTLRQKAVAPDGGSIADYHKGYRFLPKNFVMPANSLTGDGSRQPNPPYTTHEVYLDQTHVDSDRSKPIKATSFGLRVLQALKDLHANPNNAKAQTVIDQAQYDLVQRPLDEALAKQQQQREIEDEENRQWIASLKMRVKEMEKKPTPQPTAPTITKSPTSYLPLAVVGIVLMVILLFLRRRA